MAGRDEQLSDFRPARRFAVSMFGGDHPGTNDASIDDLRLISRSFSASGKPQGKGAAARKQCVVIHRHGCDHTALLSPPLCASSACVRRPSFGRLSLLHISITHSAALLASFVSEYAVALRWQRRVHLRTDGKGCHGTSGNISPLSGLTNSI